MAETLQAWRLRMIRDHPWLKMASIVGLIEVLGGVILIFVLGIQAWAPTEPARKYRLCASALAVGLILGLFVYSYHPGVLSFLDEPWAKVAAAFGGGPILLLAFTFFLDSLRKQLG